MDLLWWVTVPAFGLASVVELVVGIRYLRWGLRVRAGNPFLLTGKTIHVWWSVLFVPFYLTLPILWIEWPLAPVTIAISVMFGYYFVPYLKEVARHRYLSGYNYDADAAREEVEKALAGKDEDVVLQGHRFLAGDREVLRGIFDPPTASYWIAAPVASGREGGEVVEALREKLGQVPQKKGGRSPWLWRGIVFVGIAFVLAWTALVFAGIAWLPFFDTVHDFDLVHAAWAGDEVRVRSLLARGADPDAKDAQGRRPLHFAAVQGYVRIAEALLDAGADVDARDEEDQTPLHLAVYNGQREAVELLLSRGADIHVKDKDGKTPQAIAEAQHNAPLADLIKKHKTR